MADHGFSKEQLLQLVVDICKKHPDVLHMPELAFCHDYLESMGVRIPKVSKGESQTTELLSESEEEMESELELDNTGVIEPEVAEDFPFGDESVEVTEDMIEKSNDKRMAAVEAANKNDMEKAVSLYSEAICLNPGSALLHAKRAGLLVQLKKPMAAIRDCDMAIKLNPNAAPAYKFRGKAKGLLGMWEEAYKDLCMANKLDCDEESIEWLKQIEPNATKIIEHNRKKERRQMEKATKGSQKKRSTASTAKPAEEQGKSSSGTSPMDFMKTILENPELAGIFKNAMSDPASLLKYKDHPEFAAVLEKLKKQFGPCDYGKPSDATTQVPTDDDVD